MTQIYLQLVFNFLQTQIKLTFSYAQCHKPLVCYQPKLSAGIHTKPNEVMNFFPFLCFEPTTVQVSDKVILLYYSVKPKNFIKVMQYLMIWSFPITSMAKVVPTACFLIYFAPIAHPNSMSPLETH